VARAAFRLVDQPPSPSRNAALRVLGATGHADAEAVLREAIEGADARAAVAALRGYAALGPPDALDFLEPLLLRDLATPVRRELLAAVEALTPSER
jgi:HEAT repeat protein